MAVSPDVSPFVDLTITDRDPAEVVNRALQYAQTYLPAWVPRVGATEVVLMEALSLGVCELTYGLNRLPPALLTVLLMAGFGISQSFGTPATATVNFVLSDALAHTIPAGTVVQLALGSLTVPTLNFATTTSTAVAASGSPPTVAVAVQALVNTDQANGVATGTTMQLITNLAFVNTVALATSPTGGSPPEDGNAYLQRASVVLQRLTTTLVRPVDFLTAAAQTSGVFRVMVINNWSATAWNYLTAAQASFESGTTGTLALGNCTIAQSTTQAESGTHSLAMTATASAIMTAGTLTGTTGIGVVPGQVYTGVASFRGSTTAESTSVTINWYQSSGAPSGVTASNTGTPVTDTTSGWTQAHVTATAPSDAAYASLVYAVSTTSGHVQYVDECGFFLSDNTIWATPGGGTSTVGNITVAVLGQGDVALTGAQKATLQASLAAMASVNLGVWVVDPTVTPVNVTCSVVRNLSVTAGQAQTNAIAAIDAYLDTDTWGAGVTPWPSTMHLAELEAAIVRANGIDYVLSVSVPTADVSLPGIAPLLQAGTISVTVVN